MVDKNKPIYPLDTVKHSEKINKHDNYSLKKCRNIYEKINCNYIIQQEEIYLISELSDYRKCNYKTSKRNIKTSYSL